MSAIDTIAALAQKATPGQWSSTPVGIIGESVWVEYHGVAERTAISTPDAAMIVALRNSWPKIERVLRAAEAIDAIMRVAPKTVEALELRDALAELEKQP